MFQLAADTLLRVSEDFVNVRAWKELDTTGKSEKFTLSIGDIIVAGDINFNIDEYTNEIQIDDYFREFCNFCIEKGINFYVVSDGVDYFINKILNKNNIKGLKLISNHGEFKNGKFSLTFPNGYRACEVDSGTCKCKVAEDLKKKYGNIYYIGDGASDFCVAKKADYLFAKSELINHCKNNNIKYIELINNEKNHNFN